MQNQSVGGLLDLRSESLKFLKGEILWPELCLGLLQTMLVIAVNSGGSVSIQTVVMSAQSRPHCLTEPAPTVSSTGGDLGIPQQGCHE